MIAAKDEQVVVAQPFLKRGEAGAVLAGLALGDERRFVPTEHVEVQVVTGAREAAGAGQRIALGMNTEGAVTLDKLALDPVAFPAVTSAATAERGSGAHNICAGHGLCARLLAADGPKLGQGRRPSVGIGGQDERLAAKLHGTQSSCTYLLMRLLAAEARSVTKFFDGECAGETRRRRSDSHRVSSFYGHRSDGNGRHCLTVDIGI